MYCNRRLQRFHTTLTSDLLYDELQRDSSWATTSLFLLQDHACTRQMVLASMTGDSSLTSPLEYVIVYRIDTPYEAGNKADFVPGRRNLAGMFVFYCWTSQSPDVAGTKLFLSIVDNIKGRMRIGLSSLARTSPFTRMMPITTCA